MRRGGVPETPPQQWEHPLNERDRSPASMPGTVRIGGVEKAELLASLLERGVQLNPAGEALFDDPRFTVLAESRIVEIVSVSVAELGFPEGAVRAQVAARALESGLRECPLELGPHLRLQFAEQPEVAGGTLASIGRAPPGAITIMSPPLDDSDETPKGFYLRRLDGLSWLRGYWASADYVRGPEDVLVFSRG